MLGGRRHLTVGVVVLPTRVAVSRVGALAKVVRKRPRLGAFKRGPRLPRAVRVLPLILAGALARVNPYAYVGVHLRVPFSWVAVATRVRTRLKKHRSGVVVRVRVFGLLKLR